MAGFLFARGEMIVKKKNGLFIEPYVSPYPPPEPDNNNSDVDSQSDIRAASVSSSAATSSVAAAATSTPNTIIAVTDILTDLIQTFIKGTDSVRKDT